MALMLLTLLLWEQRWRVTKAIVLSPRDEAINKMPQGFAKPQLGTDGGVTAPSAGW